MNAPTSSLKVALLNPSYWPEVRRGAERMVRELADGLLARGHSVRLITSHAGRPSRVQEDGMEVLRLWRPPDSRLQRRMFDDHLTHAPLAYLALRAGRDDVANALSAPDAVAAGRWRDASRRGVAVFSYMGIPTRRFLVGRRLRLHTTVTACRSCDAVVALSKAAADAFWHNLGVRAEVINPGVDVQWFSPDGERAAQPTIFCNASLEVEYKRVGMLIEALPIVRRERPGVKLLLLRPRNRALADRVSQCKGVELLSPEPGKDDETLLAAYRSAWICALPSLGEAFGLVLVESLACGTPVVGTSAGGIPEIIDRPTVGRLFGGTELELAAAIIETLELAEQTDTANACRDRALEALKSANCRRIWGAIRQTTRASRLSYSRAKFGSRERDE